MSSDKFFGPLGSTWIYIASHSFLCSPLHSLNFDILKAFTFLKILYFLFVPGIRANLKHPSKCRRWALENIAITSNIGTNYLLSWARLHQLISSVNSNHQSSWWTLLWNSPYLISLNYRPRQAQQRMHKILWNSGPTGWSHARPCAPSKWITWNYKTRRECWSRRGEVRTERSRGSPRSANKPSSSQLERQREPHPSLNPMSRSSSRRSCSEWSPPRPLWKKQPRTPPNWYSGEQLSAYTDSKHNMALGACTGELFPWLESSF